MFKAIPSLKSVFAHSETGSWAGLMPFSDDGEPIVDLVDGKGLYVASGFGSFGIQRGPGTTYFLSEWLKGGPRPKILEKYRADRFKKGGEGNEKTCTF